MTAAMPMRMPSTVSADRIRRVRIASHAVRRVSGQVTTSPSSVDVVDELARRGCGSSRWAWPATSGSWVISTTVRPCACSSRKQAEHVGRRGGVEVAGGLVGEDQLRVGDQGPRHRDALLLAAGQLAGAVVDPVGEAHPGQGVDRAPRRSARGTPA